MTTDKTTTVQTLKAAARQSAKDAPKADPEVAARALDEAKTAQQSRQPAQKLSATPLKDASGENRHHPKDQVISEFDAPTE